MSLKRYALFPGCLISLRFPHIEYSAIKVLDKLGIGLSYLQGVTCCPEPVSMTMVNSRAWYAIAARNICLAEKEGLDIVTLCNGCNSTLFRVNEDLKADDKLRVEVNDYLSAIGKHFEGKINVKSILRVLYQDVRPNEIKKYISKPLEGLSVAVHPGCHIFDELRAYGFEKDPRPLKELIRVLGADVFSYPTETMCCGAFARHISKDLSLEMIEEKLTELTCVDCLVVLCPYCFLQYDLGQVEIAQKKKKDYRIPILYYHQLLGLAMGFSAQDMGLEAHKIKVDKLIASIRG